MDQIKDQKAYLDITELIAYTLHTIVDRRNLERNLARIKERGYSISRQEALLHQIGLGAAVLISSGTVAGAISARLNTEDEDTDFKLSVAERLMATAHRISPEMGFQPMDMTYSFI